MGQRDCDGSLGEWLHLLTLRERLTYGDCLDGSMACDRAYILLEATTTRLCVRSRVVSTMMIGLP